MGQKMWGILAENAGLWIAVDAKGSVVARAETLPELMGEAEGKLGLTLLYAATGDELVRS